MSDNRTPDDNSSDNDGANNRPNYRGPLFHPGHNLNVSVERNSDPTEYGPKPWLAFHERKRFRYPPVPFDTAEEANRHAAESVRKADRGLTDDDRSLWD